MTDLKAPVKDGGPAFPRPMVWDYAVRQTEEWQTEESNGVIDDGAAGMSLRDYFAGRVLPAVYREHVEGGGTEQASIAQEAYELADAMLAERGR